MNRRNTNNNNGTIVIQAMCAIVFAVFSIAWLYWFQADVLAVTQHVFSNGMTSYKDGIGAIVITIVLMLLQMLVFFFVRLRKRSHALTYLPSMLLLAILGDFQESAAGFNHKWFWLLPLILALWGVALWFAKQMFPYGSANERYGLFSRFMWCNMLIMVLMMIGVGVTTNTNAVFHYRAHVDRCIVKGNLDEALRTGKQSLETDASLTMLRAYALSLREEMGERLFQYPIAGTSQALLPLWGESRTYFLRRSTIYRHMGAVPVGISNLYRYCDLLERDSLAKPCVAHYRLCGLLIDKKLDEFAEHVARYYPELTSLPKHYREALTLYVHRRSNPIVEFHDPVMEEDWKNFQELDEAYPDPMARKGIRQERYATSYWYYYLYNK